MNLCGVIRDALTRAARTPFRRPARRRPLLRAGRAAMLALAVFFVLHAAAPVRAVPPKYFDITNARLETASGDIVARLSITVDNVLGLFEMLKDGASVELVVQARLERLRTFWANVTLAEMELFSTLQHNPLTREFALCMPGETTPMLDRNLERLLAATWQKFSLSFGSLDILDGDKDSEYRVSLTLFLQHAKPPPWLAKNFMLWSKEIVDPETVELPFSF